MKIAFCDHFYPKWHRNNVSSTSSFGIHSSLISPVFYIKRRPNIFRFLSKYVGPHVKHNKYMAFISQFKPFCAELQLFP